MLPIIKLNCFRATKETPRSETVVCDDMDEKKLIALANVCDFATVNTKHAINADMCSKIVQYGFFSMECCAQWTCKITRIGQRISESPVSVLRLRFWHRNVIFIFTRFLNTTLRK